MRYRSSVVQDCLRAELIGRESAAETQEFIRAIGEQAQKWKLLRIIVCVRRSRPIFKVEQCRISEHFKALGASPALRVALVGHTEALRAAHQYIEVLARPHGANVRAFGDEARALDWLKQPALQSQENR